MHARQKQTRSKQTAKKRTARFRGVGPRGRAGRAISPIPQKSRNQARGGGGGWVDLPFKLPPLPPSLFPPSCFPSSTLPLGPHLVLEHLWIPHDGLVVRRHAVVIHQHLLLVVELRVRAEVVGEVGRLGLLVAVVRGDLPRAALVGEGVFRHLLILLLLLLGRGGGGVDKKIETLDILLSDKLDSEIVVK